jgi:hypothetical protein
MAGPLGREPGRVEHPEVDRRGDDDGAARDGRDGARDLRAALLLADREAQGSPRPRRRGSPRGT